MCAVKPFPDFLGIPEDDYHVHKLVFSPTAEALAVLMRANALRPPMERLFVRYRGEANYVPIGELNPDISASSVAACESAPLLAYSQTEWKPNKWGVGGNPAGLEILNLEKRRVIQRIEADDLKWEEQANRSWVADVLAFGPNNKLYVSGGIMSGSEANYFVWVLDLTTLAMRRVAPLQHTHY